MDLGDAPGAGAGAAWAVTGSHRRRTPRLHVALVLAVVSAAVPAAIASDDAGEAFLAENSKKEDVVTLESGLQYRIIDNAPAGSDGPAKSGEEEVLCHYEGKLLSGEVFDSSYKRGRPATLKVKSTVKGMGEAMKMMHVGDKWELFMPSELGYGKKGAGKTIPPDSVLIFTLEVLSFGKSSKAKKQWKEDWEEWFHGTSFTVFGFRITRMITMPFYAAVFISLIRAVVLARQQSSCKARHINTKTQEDCYKALSRVNKGEDFGVVAKELSICRSKDKGGSLGSFGKGVMAPEFDEKCFDDKTEIGKVYGPLKTQFGWHILIVDERHISASDELEAMKMKDSSKKRR